MQIFVKDPAGKTVTIDDVVPSDTIATVLDQFERKTQMRADMRYVYRGRPLDIDKPLDHYGIRRTDTIHCYLAPASRSCDTRHVFQAVTDGETGLSSVRRVNATAAVAAPSSPPLLPLSRRRSSRRRRPTAAAAAAALEGSFQGNYSPY